MLKTGLVLAVAVMATSQSYAQDARDFERCAGLEDSVARLACYDEISNRQVPAEPAEPAEPEAPVAVAEPIETVEKPVAKEPQPLTEEVGQEQLDRRGESREEPETFAGRVTNCRQDAAHKWYFFFGNGQVWKQKDSGSLRFSDCDFDATIRRDFFGYKMQVVGDDKEVRVARVR